MYDGVKLYPPGLNFTSVSASSTIKNMLALLHDLNTYTHSPGPNGLPGGYPVVLNANGAEVTLPDDISLPEAIRMNEEAGRLDGVERIEDEEKIIMDCFDDHRRSSMVMSMAVMQRNGVLADSDLTGFSDELRDRMKALREL